VGFRGQPTGIPNGRPTRRDCCVRAVDLSRSVRLKGPLGDISCVLEIDLSGRFDALVLRGSLAGDSLRARTPEPGTVY
jgi:hypothetical protein